MRKKTFNFLEIILIVIIILVCSISLLQNETIFGYHSYEVTSNSNEKIEKGDLVLVKELNIDKLKPEDIVAYKIKDKEVIISKVEEIVTNNDIKGLRVNNSKNIIYEEQLYGKYKYKFIIFGVIIKIIANKIGFALCVLIPFITLLILELLNIQKDNKRKEIENDFKEQLEILNNIDSNSELKEVLEKEIETKIVEIQNAKKDFKKMDKLEQTIQIPLVEIQKQIKELNKNKKNSSKEDTRLEDTLVLFSSDDIKEEIKKELSTKTVDKKKKSKDKTTEIVEKSKKDTDKSTNSVDEEL